ncbi:MAG TPA: sigma-70 family RNA polymerase sigma factor [bacterium]|nr:sigma-70 family RNA polymerase sigma factor [bacterium]
MKKYREENDTELIRRIQTGDEKAFEEIIRRYSNRIINLATQIMGSQDEGWDIAQEVFISVWKNIKSFDISKNFYPWVRKITINACYEELRRRKGHIESSLDDVEEGEPSIDVPDDAYSPEDIFDKIELKEAVEEALNSLPKHYRVTLWLRIIENLSYEEIAETLEINIGTVKSRINMARKMMQDRLKYYLEEKDESS